MKFGSFGSIPQDDEATLPKNGERESRLENGIRYFFRFTLKLVRIGLASVDYVEDILQFRERAGIFGIDGHLLPVEWMSVVMYTDRI